MVPNITANSSQIRPANLAGRFYAQDCQALAREVDDHLRAAAKRDSVGLHGQCLPHGPVKALICPHAGYIFSAPVAASAYITLQQQAATIQRVVLVGPAHRLAIHGLVVVSWQAFDTPLGPVPVATVTQDLCADGLASIVDAAHDDEHCLEVQLPFLQRVLSGPFEIVPILFGQCESSDIEAVLHHLWGGAETLILISSDLSHFHPQAEAVRLDRHTSLAIENLDADDVDEESACGRTAVQALLSVAARRGMTATAVDVRTSADTAGGADRVVGYGAYVFVDGRTG